MQKVLSPTRTSDRSYAWPGQMLYVGGHGHGGQGMSGISRPVIAGFTGGQFGKRLNDRMFMKLFMSA